MPHPVAGASSPLVPDVATTSPPLVPDVAAASSPLSISPDQPLPDDNDGPTDNGAAPAGRPARRKTRTVYGSGAPGLELFWNMPNQKRTIRIDSKLLAEAEGLTRDKSRQEAAEELRKVVATVGKPGQPGEHVRCVVSVAMLNEGWDANNVTQVLGIRAFDAQLLCKHVVGRGLRRIDYTPDPETGLLTEEYVDVYGIPFSVIPFEGRAEAKGAGSRGQAQEPRAGPVGTGPDLQIRGPVRRKQGRLQRLPPVRTRAGEVRHAHRLLCLQ